MNLADLPWPAVAALSPDTPVVIPVAALEQHGPHLPVFTDSRLLGEVVARVAPRFGGAILWTPLQWLGNSDHHADFPGTVSAPPRLYLDLLGGLAENFIRHGFRRIVFLNGHGGNEVPGRQAVFELRQRHRDVDGLLLVFATYWSLGHGPVAGFRQESMGHACEWETSMMLRLDPAGVGSHGDLDPILPGRGFDPAARGWTTRERSGPGYIGFPHLASADKGEALFARFAGDVAAFLQRVIDWDGRSWDG